MQRDVIIRRVERASGLIKRYTRPRDILETPREEHRLFIGDRPLHMDAPASGFLLFSAAGGRARGARNVVDKPGPT